MQRTQKLQRIKRSESLQKVHESQATQRSQATQDSFSRSRPMPAKSLRNRLSKVRALNFVSLGMAQCCRASGPKHAAQLRRASARLGFLSAVFQALQTLFEHGQFDRRLLIEQRSQHFQRCAYLGLVRVLEQLQLHRLLFGKWKAAFAIGVRRARYG